MGQLITLRLLQNGPQPPARVAGWASGEGILPEAASPQLNSGPTSAEPWPIVGNPYGCLMLAHGFKIEQLAVLLVRDGLATAQPETVQAGSQPIEVVRVQINAIPAGGAPNIVGTDKRRMPELRASDLHCRMWR